MERFQERVLLATGGGSGIARAVARRFTAEGGRVAVVDFDRNRAEQAASELDGAVALAVDVSDEESVVGAVQSVSKQLGRIDCVLNAAGHAEFGPIDEWSLDRWNRMMGVHCGGTFLVCREVLPIMRKQSAGAIVNIASTAALVANQHNSPYGAAKGAIIAFSRQLARDVAPDIRVNVVAPGRVRTGMTEGLVTKRGHGSYEEGAKAFSEANLQKRLGEPEEIAAPICFLLADEASFITGTVLVADAGDCDLMEQTTKGTDVSSPASGWANPPSTDVVIRLQNLVVAYAAFVDSGRAKELAGLFTSDAVWDGSELGFGVATGPDQIVQNVLRHFKVEEPMMHLPGPPLLTHTSDTTAEGLGWCMATRWVDGQTTPVIYFSYEDHFVGDDEGCWRFGRRYLRSAFPPRP